jgi:hypothetical protein
MIDHILTDKEFELVLEVLEAESKRLAVEERRTDTHAMKKQLRERQRAVERIAERLQEMHAGDYKVS